MMINQWWWMMMMNDEYEWMNDMIWWINKWLNE